MAGKTERPKIESAHEEFARRIKELYALAEKMGFRLSISVRRENAAMAGNPSTKAGQPAEAVSSRRREPGEE